LPVIYERRAQEDAPIEGRTLVQLQHSRKATVPVC